MNDDQRSSYTWMVIAAIIAPIIIALIVLTGFFLVIGVGWWRFNHEDVMREQEGASQIRLVTEEMNTQQPAAKLVAAKKRSRS